MTESNVSNGTSSTSHIRYFKAVGKIVSVGQCSLGAIPLGSNISATHLAALPDLSPKIEMYDKDRIPTHLSWIANFTTRVCRALATYRILPKCEFCML